jgi:hypothetical protein
MIRFSRNAILAGLFLATVLSVPSFADSTLSIVPATSSVAQGSNTTLDVNVSDVSDLFAYQFDLTFNPAFVSAISTAEGPSFVSGGGFVPGTIDNVGGDITFTADTLFGDASFTGSGTLAIITMKGLAPGTSSLDFANVILLDPSFDFLPTNLDTGTLTVTSGTVPTPEPGLLALLMVGLSFLAFTISRKDQEQPEGEV